MAVELERIFLGGTKGQLRDQLKVLTQPGILEVTNPPRHSMHLRTPDVITTRRWLSQGDYIRCFINPQETSWGVTRRETFTKTSSGFVRNTWRNRYRGTYLDNYNITFTFHTGNLMPSSAYVIDLSNPDAILEFAKKPRVPPGLANFYKYLGLTDQTALNGTSANYHIIIHHTRLFPQIWIEGFFDPQGPSWAESSESGNSVRWSSTFVVHRTVPKITSYETLMALYSDWVLNAGVLGEALPIEAAKSTSSDKEIYQKIFGNWGFGDFPTDGPTKKDPTKVMRSSKEGDPFAEGIGIPDLGRTVGQSSGGQTTNPRTKILSQGSLNNSSPFDNLTII